MTERGVPMPIVAWLTPNGSTKSTAARAFRRKSDAYYRIAKSIVLARYNRGNAEEQDESRFRDRMHSYQGADDEAGQAAGVRFDPQKWKTLCWRLAKFLAFVDTRRGETAAYRNCSDIELHERFEYCERQAQEWMERARAIEHLRLAMTSP